MHALYFTATWCQPCKVFGPVMEKIKDVIDVGKFDIQQEMDVTASYEVMSVPTVVFVNESGHELGRFVGARTEQWVRDFIKELE